MDTDCHSSTELVIHRLQRDHIDGKKTGDFPMMDHMVFLLILALLGNCWMHHRNVHHTF